MLEDLRLDRLHSSFLRSGRGWEEFYVWAKDNRITPILYWQAKHNPNRVHYPPWLFSRLKDHFTESSIRNLVLLQESERVRNRLKAARIEVIPLKGVVLATTVYPDPGLRPFSDIDLLIHKSDLAAAKRLLLDEGYCAVPVLRNGFAEDYTNTVSFVREAPGFPIVIEVHWHLVYFPTYVPFLKIGEFWATAQAGRINDCEMLTLRPEYHLVQLCLHYYLHAACYLIWLIDIALFINRNRPVIDWTEVMRVARRFRIEEAVTEVLGAVSSAFGVAIPLPQPDVNHRGFDPRTAALRIISRNPDHTGLASLLNLLFVPKLADKFYFLAASLFPQGFQRTTGFTGLMKKLRRATNELGQHFIGSMRKS